MAFPVWQKIFQNGSSQLISDNNCICKITDEKKILNLGDHTVIEKVEFVGLNSPGLSLDTKCQVAEGVTHKFVLTCNNKDEEFVASACPPATVLLSIVCAVLAFIAIVLYVKLRKANQRPTANEEG